MRSNSVLSPSYFHTSHTALSRGEAEALRLGAPTCEEQRVFFSRGTC